METSQKWSPSAKEVKSLVEDIAKNCPKCYGRGYTGITLNNKPVVCSCIRKRLRVNK